MKKKAGILLATVLCPLASLAAQTAEDVVSGLDFARHEIDQNRVEEAASALREAYAKLKLLSSDEKRKVGKAEKDLTALLKKTDPKGKRLIDIRVKAALDLQRLGQDYAKLGWDDTAMRVFLQAQALQREVVSENLQELRKKFEADAGRRFAKAGKNKDLLAWFHLGERIGFNRVPWEFSNFGILAPKTDEKGGSAVLQSNKELGGDVRIKLEIKPGPSGAAAIFWNHRRKLEGNRYLDSFCCLTLTPRISEALVTMSTNDNLQTVGRGSLIMGPFKNEWIPIEIEQRGESVTIKLPKGDPIQFKAFAKNKGYLALEFQTKSRSDPQAEFRHLTIEHID